MNAGMINVLPFLFHDVYERDPAESGFRGHAADRYKLTVEEFDVQLRGLARVRRDRPILVTELVQDPQGPVPFVITVDDGGVSYHTRVADRLEALRWRGHCLVTTSCIGRPGFLDKRQLRDLDARGHVIGSHSVSHPARFGACPWSRMVREWRESRQALEDILGRDVRIASVPGGYFSPPVARAAAEAGLSVLFTSEPETRVRRVAGCTVLGRFTVRRGCGPDFALMLGRLEAALLRRERLIWNVKKIAKALLGSCYPWLAGLRGSHHA